MDESYFYDFEKLSTKEGFNKSLAHFQGIADIIGDFEDYYNLADLINELLTKKEMQQNQILPTVYALLVDKYYYFSLSFNLKKTLNEFSPLYETVKKWKGVDAVILYHHPDLGPTLLNPKNKKHFEFINNFKSNELITIYTGMFSDPDKNGIKEKAAKAIAKYFDGSKITTNDKFLKGKYAFKPVAAEAPVVKKKSPGRKKAVKTAVKSTVKKEAVKPDNPPQQPEPSAVGGRMTPLYSVPVTNELFHNGNVEAWKKIIQSYKTKHPGLEVYIYYDGERIHDIHSLFKWGKVKHGSTILFAVKGENIKDVAKLQRYFRQGASPMFESFLKFPVNKILNLF